MKIQVLKSVVLITVDFTAADVEFLKAVSPSSLELKSEDGNILFVADVGETPSISNYGVVISAKRDIVLEFDKPVTRELVEQQFPNAFLRLPLLETKIAQELLALRGQMSRADFEVIEE